MMDENKRPTTITAAEWSEIAADVEAGRCIVWDFAGDSVENIVKDGKLFRIVTIDPDASWHSRGNAELTVRWLDPAPAVDVGESRYDIQVEADANGWYDGKMEAQAEITQLRQQLEATGQCIRAARKYIAELFDDEQRFDTSKQGRFVTETLNFADSALMDAGDVVKGTATPQPPDNSELVAAVKPFAETFAKFDAAQDENFELGLFEWMETHLDEEGLYASLERAAAALKAGEA